MILWTDYPTAILYTIDNHGFGVLWSTPAFLTVSGSFASVTGEPPVMTFGLVGSPTNGGAKFVNPNMTAEDQAKVLAACVAPGRQGPVVTGTGGSSRDELLAQHKQLFGN